jgi:hypothetical protein
MGVSMGTTACSCRYSPVRAGSIDFEKDFSYVVKLGGFPNRVTDCNLHMEGYYGNNMEESKTIA